MHLDTLRYIGRGYSTLCVEFSTICPLCMPLIMDYDTMYVGTFRYIIFRHSTFYIEFHTSLNVMSIVPNLSYSDKLQRGKNHISHMDNFGGVRGPL